MLENLIVEIKANQQKEPPPWGSIRKKRMSVQRQWVLIWMLWCGAGRGAAHQIIQQAIEAELAELMVRYASVTTLSGRQAVVRKRLPARARGAHGRWAGAGRGAQGA